MNKMCSLLAVKTGHHTNQSSSSEVFDSMSRDTYGSFQLLSHFLVAGYQTLGLQIIEKRGINTSLQLETPSRFSSKYFVNPKNFYLKSCVISRQKNSDYINIRVVIATDDIPGNQQYLGQMKISLANDDVKIMFNLRQKYVKIIPKLHKHIVKNC